MKRILTIVLILLALSATTGYSQVGLTATLGTPTGSFTTLKDAFDAINLGTHQGAIVITVTGSTTETASAVLNASSAPSSYSTILIQPSGVASITGSIVGHLIDLNGANNVTIDGIGSGGNSLTILNAALGATSAIRLYNDASNNLIQNCSLQASTTASFGVVTFGAGVTTGSDGNTITKCNIGPAGSNLPLNGIYSLGTSATIENNNNTVSNNNIFDYFSAGSASHGMNVNTGNSGWTISGNSFYQTSSRTYTTGSVHNAVYITSGGGYNISGNYVGGSAAGATGSAYTMGGSVANSFYAIYGGFTATSPVSSIQGNTIANFNISTASANIFFMGIGISTGSANIGNITPNIIGSGSTTGSIVTTTSVTGGATMGIYAASTAGTLNVSNNVIGSITAYGSGATISASIYGMYLAGGTPTVSGNTIGSNSTANSLNSATVSTSTTSAQGVIGISLTSGVTTTCSITNNVIANMNQAGTGSAHVIRGIAYAGTGVCTISGNTIHDLSGASSNTTQSGGGTAVQGIIYTGGSTDAIITGNTIYTIRAINTGAVSTTVAGIGYSNPTAGTISKNKIYDLRNASTGTSATAPPQVVGLLLRAVLGSTNFVNNMISLGDAQTTNTQFSGIMNSFNTSGPINIYFNSIYIGGTASSGALPTFCFYRGNNSATALLSPVDIRNNVFVNTRSGGTGSHFAIANNYGATASATGWGANASNYNVLNAAAGTVGYWSSNQTFSGWKTASACDGNSFSGYTVTFVGTSTGNLHLNMGTSATVLESNANPISGITVDYDNDTRPGPTGSVNGGGSAPDLGADEFDGVPLDLNPPVIVYSPLANTNLTGNRNLIVTVTDPSGVPTFSNGWPYLYWKKTGDPSYTAVPPASYLGNNQFSYDFGGSASLGDVVQYYVVAQDNSPAINVGAYPSGASGFTSFPPAASAPPTTPSSYTIVTPLNGDYIVGTTVGNPYATITAAINDLNVRGVSGPVRFLLEDASYTTGETYPFLVNVNNVNYPTATNTVILKPKSGVTTAITGSSANSTIFDIRTSYFTIDGSNTVGGTSRDLTITNSSATFPDVVDFTTVGTTNMAGAGLLNCTIVNGSNSSSAVTASRYDGNAGAYITNLTIQNNSISTAYVGIYIWAESVAGNGAGTVISGNVLNGSGTASVRLIGIYAQGLDGATISGNTVGNMSNAAETSNITGIWLASGTINTTLSGNTITGLNGTAGGPRGIAVTPALANANIMVSGNTISGISTASTASPLGIYVSGSTSNITLSENTISGINTATTATSSGIYVSGAISNITLEKNVISNVKNTNTGGYGSNGIQLSSSLASSNIKAVNNVVYDVAAYGYAGGDVADNGYGIIVTSGGGYKIYYNSVSMNTDQTVAGYPAAFNVLAAVTTAGGIDLRNNIFSNSMTVGTERYAIYSGAASSVYSTIDYNDYYATGANLGFIGSNRVDLAAIQTGFGGNTHSISSNPQFTSLTNLLPLTGSPVTGAGEPLPGVVDFDIVNTARSATAPTIGAYELVVTSTVFNLKAYLEGLYNGSGGMNQAQESTDGENTFPVFTSYADTVTIALAENVEPNYSFVHYFHGTGINTDGTLSLNVPSSVSGEFFVVLQHRNSVETWSALPVTFPSVTPISLDWTLDSNNTYGWDGGNEKPGNGFSGAPYVIYSGEVCQTDGSTPPDGYIDGGDVGNIFNLAQIYDYGYKPEDLTGDGFIDGFDVAIVFNNAQVYAGKETPQP